MIYSAITWSWDMYILGGVCIKLADLRYKRQGFKFYCASHYLVFGTKPFTPLCL